MDRKGDPLDTEHMASWRNWTVGLLDPTTWLALNTRNERNLQQPDMLVFEIFHIQPVSLHRTERGNVLLVGSYRFLRHFASQLSGKY